MRETTLICDRCKQKAKWLYEIPRPIVEGLNLNWYPSKYELCEECTRNLCSVINNYHKSYVVSEEAIYNGAMEKTSDQ